MATKHKKEEDTTTLRRTKLGQATALVVNEMYDSWNGVFTSDNGYSVAWGYGEELLENLASSLTLIRDSDLQYGMIDSKWALVCDLPGYSPERLRSLLWQLSCEYCGEAENAAPILAGTLRAQGVE